MPLCDFTTQPHTIRNISRKSKVVAVFWSLTKFPYLSHKLVSRRPSFLFLAVPFLTLLKIRASKVGLDDSKGDGGKKKKVAKEAHSLETEKRS